MRPPLLPRVAALAVAVGVCAAQPVRAATVSTLNPIADAFVTTGPTGALAETNYGGAGGLALSAPGLANGEFQSLLRFDTGPAKAAFDAAYGPGSWTIESATLQLTATPPNNPIFNANTAGTFSVIWTADDGWTEGTGSPNAPAANGITYSTLQALIGAGTDAPAGTFTFDGTSSGAKVFALGLPPAFVADLTAGTTVTLRAAAADPTVSFLFNSRSAGAPANRPVLTLTAIPEPGLGTLLSAAVVLGSRRRRPAVRSTRPDVRQDLRRNDPGLSMGVSAAHSGARRRLE